MTELAPDLTERPSFRQAFVVYAGANRADFRAVEPESTTVPVSDVSDSLLPLLRVETRPFGDASALADQLNRVVPDATRKATAWRPREIEFLTAINERGQILPELLTPDPVQQGIIGSQPQLHWKAQNVRRHRGIS